MYRGKNVVDTFLSMLLTDVQRLDRKFIEPNTMTEDDERGFQNATQCHLCKEPLTDEKVRNTCLLYTSRCV